MKTHPLIGPASTLAVGVLLATATLAAPAAPAAVSPAPAAAGAKTHTLFMGADISIEYNKAVYRVQDIAGGSFVIEVDGKPVRVSMDRGPVSLKVGNSLKLTEVSATISHLNGERAYTPANDPNRKILAAQSAAIALNNTAGDAAARLNQDMAAAQQAGNTLGPLDSAQQRADAVNSAMAAADTRYNQAIQASRSDVFDAGRQAGTLAIDLSHEAYDAIELSFTISADRALANPYIAVITTFRAPDAKPGEQSTWVYAKSLDPITDKPAKVHILRGGFPEGFELKSYQVHLYNNGNEVATNVAPKHVLLTRDEAAQYLVLEYIGAHKNATLPAVPMMGRLPADLPARVSSGQVKPTVYVKVSNSGEPLEAYLDETCSNKVDDPYVSDVVRNLRFKPALNKGKPVDGVATVNLSKLTL